MVRHCYYLQLPVEGLDRGNLPDALEDEELPLTDLVPLAEVCRQVREGEFTFLHEGEERLREFGKNLEVFSVYLPQVVRGFHLEIESEGDSEKLLSAEKWLGVKGEVVALPLRLPDSLDPSDLDPEADDLDYLRREWANLPRWVQDGMRRKWGEPRGL